MFQFLTRFTSSAIDRSEQHVALCQTDRRLHGLGDLERLQPRGQPVVQAVQYPVDEAEVSLDHCLAAPFIGTAERGEGALHRQYRIVKKASFRECRAAVM